jgi:predicted ATPase/DNA-binding winged helix-turn-helix (wHTH) protein
MTAVVLPEYRFGDFRLLRDQRQLLANGDAVKLGARAFDVLLALVERSDRVVPKHELMELVWPKLVVEENNLQVQMVALRKLLGPGAIATVPGRGYRFTLEMQTSGAEAPVGAATHANAPDIDRSAPLQPERTNLPRRLPVLFGRKADIARVRELLADHAVVTIAGAGGIGKTRLAQTVASDIAREAPGNFADGVWMVELAALSDGELVTGAVARVLSVAQAGDRALVDALTAALRTQSLLLVLDNCEHLLQAVAGLVEAISQGAPAVRILVTSQEPLKTTEEHVFRLDTLAVPAADGATDAAPSGAVQLFVERARAADPRFAMTPDNAAAVADICRRLDGIPLALELAAARVALLGVEGLRARLDERLQILTGGSRFVLRRHQTLRAALEFSHGLLSVEERVVFRRLGVFAGSFALEVAQEVAADDRIDTWDVLEHLGTLVDKSMVVAEEDKPPRLRLLETTRAYALEKLADADETATMLERHASAIARLFARMYDEFWDWSDNELVARYEPELDNLRAALAWGLRNEPEAAIALTGDSRPLWVNLALQPEGRLHCEAALARMGATTPQRVAGRLWHALAAMLANALPAQSCDAAARAIELLRHADDPGTLAAALMTLASGSTASPTQQTLAALEELERLNSPQWPPRMRMLLPNARARVHRAAGRFSEARRDYELTRNLAASCGATQWELAAQDNIADVALIMGDLDVAIASYRETVHRMAPGRDKQFYGFALASLATALLFKSEAAAARDALATAVPLIVRYDLGARYAATAALLAVKEERPTAAARLLGYGDAAFVAHDVDAHDPAELKARNLALEWLRSVATAGEIEQWMREGAQFSTEEAYGLALAPPTI